MAIAAPLNPPITSNPVRILIVEDSRTLAETYAAFLDPLDTNVSIAATGAEAQEKLDSFLPDIVFLDLNLPDMDGFEILRAMVATHHPAKVIVITADESVRTAVLAMQEGASDYLTKPIKADRLLVTTRNMLEILELQHALEARVSEPKTNFGRFIGTSPPMMALYRTIKGAAPSRASVFIVGESGTGKELTAEAVHENSPRADGPFVALNCAAIPENLIESEIFGHKKGAFTGAVSDRDGAAVRADGGTLFLDEICDMPLDMQAKLLRFIQTGQVVPVGSNQMRKVNVRFVCATNRNPWACVEAGEFREDLYYRLHVIPVQVPPLRTRGEDIIQIAEHLLAETAREESKDFTHLSEDAINLLLDHSWPGNVRELGNLIQSAVVLHNGSALTAEMLRNMMGPTVRRNRPVTDVAAMNIAGQPLGLGQRMTPGPAGERLPAAGGILPLTTLAETERQAIESALNHCRGQVTQAAQILDVHPSTLYRKMKDWGLDPRTYKGYPSRP